jgi:hypothetical protein
MKFTTVRQVCDALHWNRHRIGHTPLLSAEAADGGFGRIYFLTVHLEGPRPSWTGGPGRINILNGQWRDGAMSRRELLAWANENMDATPWQASRNDRGALSRDLVPAS